MNHQQMLDRLVLAFPRNQAEVLATLVEELHDEQVKRTDFTDLKDLVRDLAISQHELAGAQIRTEQRVEELAQAQNRLAEAQHRTEISLQNLGRQVGGLSEALGANLEDLACDIVPELLEKHWGMQVASAAPEGLAMGADESYEFDLVVRGSIGGRAVLVLGETKSNVTASEVGKFQKIVERYRKCFPDEEVRMLFFGFRADRATKDRIASIGACMVFSRGVLFPSVEKF